MAECSLQDLYFPFNEYPFKSNKLNNLPIRIHTTVFFVDLFIRFFFFNFRRQQEFQRQQELQRQQEQQQQALLAQQAAQQAQQVNYYSNETTYPRYICPSFLLHKCIYTISWAGQLCKNYNILRVRAFISSADRGEGGGTRYSGTYN